MFVLDMALVIDIIVEKIINFLVQAKEINFQEIYIKIIHVSSLKRLEKRFRHNYQSTND